MSRVLQALRQSRASLPGLVAQGFTFATLFLPVLFQRTEVVVFLVQVNAIAAFLLQIVLLAVELRLPVEADDKLAATALRASLLTLIIGSSALGLVGQVMTGSGASEWGAVISASGLLLFGQGVFVVGVASLTRRLDYQTMMRGRFIYGVATFAFTLACCLTNSGPLWFVFSAGVAYIVAAIATGSIPRESIGPISLRAWSREVRASSHLIASYATGGFASSAASIAVGLVGPLQPAWALICRVMGGMQTVGGQVVGPMVDVGVAESVQNGRDARQAVNLAWRLGCALVLLFLIGTVLTLWWSGELTWLPSQSIALFIGGVGFAAAYVFQSPMSRTLGMLGDHRIRLAWDLGRFVTAGGVVLLFRGEALVVALGIQGLVSIIVYMILVRAVSRIRPAPDEAVAGG